MDIIVSKHAEQRLKERCGLNKKSVQRITEKAFENGIRHRELKGNMRKWVDGLYLHEQKANNIRLYGDKAFLFCGKILVTVIQIPASMRNELKVYVK